MYLKIWMRILSCFPTKYTQYSERYCDSPWWSDDLRKPDRRMYSFLKNAFFQIRYFMLGDWTGAFGRLCGSLSVQKKIVLSIQSLRSVFVYSGSIWANFHALQLCTAAKCNEIQYNVSFSDICASKASSSVYNCNYAKLYEIALNRLSSTG